LQAAKKVNVLDKSRADWSDFKTSDTKVPAQAPLRFLSPCPELFDACSRHLVLASLQGAKDVNILEKSRADQCDYKTSATKVTPQSSVISELLGRDACHEPIQFLVRVSARSGPSAMASQAYAHYSHREGAL